MVGVAREIEWMECCWSRSPINVASVNKRREEYKKKIGDKVGPRENKWKAQSVSRRLT